MEAMQIKGFSDGVAMAGRVVSLQMNKLWKSLQKKPLKSYNEVIVWSHKYVNLEENSRGKQHTLNGGQNKNGGNDK